MKHFIKGAGLWIKYACMMFTGSVCVYGLIMFAQGSSQLAIGILLQLLLLSFLGTLIQGIAFVPDWIIRKARYTTRMIIFVIPFLLLLTAFAVVFRWFPMDNMSNWLSFIGIFLVIFIVLCTGFELMFRLSGKKYDGLLGQYKKRQEHK